MVINSKINTFLNRTVKKTLIFGIRLDFFVRGNMDSAIFFFIIKLRINKQ